MPADIVLTAINQHRRKCRFWPKPAELVEIGDALLEERKRDIRRMQKLLTIPTAEEKAEAEREAAEAKRRAHEERLATDVEFRIKTRWWSKFSMIVPIHKWLPFLRAALEDGYTEAEIDSWHAAVDAPFDAMPLLKAKRWAAEAAKYPTEKAATP